jgi:putative hydrolase of the HAD superfamily
MCSPFVEVRGRHSTISIVRLRGILFDLDGTLADTAGAERDAWPALAEVIRSHVPELDVEELHERYSTLFEPHWTDFLEGRIDFGEYRWNRLSAAITPWSELDEQLFDAYRAEKRHALDGLRLFDDALQTIHELRGCGLRIGLLTNGPSWLQRRKLAVTGLEPELDGIAISEEIGAAKPEAEAFHTAARMIACEPAEIAMIGDSPVYDIAGAIGAGLGAAVLVTGGLAVEAEGATVVTRLAKIPDRLRNL